jgi:cathepsin D
MLFTSLPFSVALVALLSIVESAFAAPHPVTRTAGQSIPLLRKRTDRSVAEWGTWAKNHKLALEIKYGGSSSKRRRASGTNLIVNQNADSR